MVQDPPDVPSDTLLLSSLKCLYKTNVRIQERLQLGDSRPVLTPSQITLSRQIMRNWKPWQTLESLIITGWFNSCLFINNNPSRLPVFKTLTLDLAQTMTMSPLFRDRFSVSQWESFFWSNLGVSTPTLLEPAQQCTFTFFSYDTFGDHSQTFQTKSATSQVNDLVVYKLGMFLVPWVTKLKFIKLHLQRRRNVVTSRSKTM